jgi:hypothetical protein
MLGLHPGCAQRSHAALPFTSRCVALRRIALRFGRLRVAFVEKISGVSFFLFITENEVSFF